MAIKKSSSGWLVDSQPSGRGGKRFRKTFKTQAEAKAHEAWLKSQVSQNADWAPKKKDLRKLSALIGLWFDYHGTGLSSGVDTKQRLLSMANAIGDPIASNFSASMFAEYRTRRLEAGLSANSMNREHAYLRSVFNELARLGYWNAENPLGKLRQFKVQQTELSYLTYEQIEKLLLELKTAQNPHVCLVTRVCLSTGARWSEAEELRSTQVRDGQIQFAKTKSGKVRSVPISDELQSDLEAHYKAHGDGARIFGYAYSAFREGIGRTGIELPDGQLTHCLRHSFASHFMMNGGNILVLQRILGHASLTMTMRYAHLAPEHLQEAKHLNPLASLKAA